MASSHEQTVDATSTGDESFDDPRKPRAPVHAVASGDRIGRYVALEHLGAGAMGVVWSAWDPELDRRVAIKLLRVRSGSDASNDRIRLQREAQALARLSHPNVVGVFDVGMFGDQLFIAMEHVAGQTLRDWSSSTQPSVDARLQALIAAGRGLVAAHGAGLIHRDFKPENVMIDEQGRVRVMDFGLARESNELGPGRASVTGIDDSLRSGTLVGSASELTRAGALVGTPAYMAPEQVESQSADARSDQFSFCVSAWEVLTGKRPFAGESFAALVFAATEGRIQAPPPGTMSAALRQALERGLAADPSKRWPSIEALLEAMTHDPSHRRRRWIVSAGIGAALLAAIVGASISQPNTDASCNDPDVQLAGTWDPDRRAALAAGFASSSSPLAEPTATELELRLDAWAGRWTIAGSESCLGEHTLAPELRPAQLSCLARQRVELGALVEVLIVAEPATVRNALVAASKLPDPELCNDPVALASAVSPPNAAVAEDVERLRAELASVRSRRNAGDYAGAEAALDELLAAIDATEYLPIRAEAQSERGQLLEKRKQSTDATAALLLAGELALAAGDDVEATRAILLAAGIAGQDKSNHDTYAALFQLATGLSTRAGDPYELRRQRIHIEGAAAYSAADYAKAQRAFELELELLREHEPDSVALGDVLMSLSAVHHGLGQLDVAAGWVDQAQAHFTRVLPASHPKVASAIDRRGALLYEQGKVQDAREIFTAAIAVYEAGLGPEHPETLSAQNNLAGMEMVLGENQAAEARYRRVLEIRQQVLDPDDKEIGTSMCNLAAVVNTTNNAEALELYAAGVAIIENKTGPNHPDIAWIALNFATALRSAGELDRALEWGKRSVEIRETLGPDHPHLAMSLHALGETFVMTGDNLAAEANMSRAVEIWEKVHGPDHPNLATGLASLGDVEITLGEFEQAREHLVHAQRIYTKAPQGHEQTLGAVEANLGRLALKDDDPAGAVERLDAAIGWFGETPSSYRALAFEALADARWASGDRTGARAAMSSALADHVATEAEPAARDRCEAWLAAHR